MESLTGVLSEEALGKRYYEAVMGEREGGQPFCAHGCSVMHLARSLRPASSFERSVSTKKVLMAADGPVLAHPRDGS